MYIERPRGLDIGDELVTLTLRDVNGLRAGTITIRANDFGDAGDVVRISVDRVPGDQSLRVEFISVS